MKNSRLRISTRLALALAVLAAAVLAAPAVFADFAVTDWRYVKAIVLPSGIGEESLVELTPDAEVFEGAATGLVDLRVISGDGTEVSYKFEITRGQRERQSISASLRDKGHVPGEYTTFIAELGSDGAIHNEVEIVTSSTNFRRTATVETSDDAVRWLEVAEEEIYDFTIREQAVNSRDTSIRYTESTAPYLRVRIADEGEGPLDVTSARVFSVKETQPREVRWPASVLDINQQPEGRATFVEIDLGVSGLPSQRLEADVPEVNFYRQVDLEASDDAEDWRPVNSGAIWAYDTPTFSGSNLTLAYPEVTARYFRVVIHNQDNPPLDVRGVDAWGIQRRLVFWASPQQSYSLYYGNPEARRPSYDIEQVFPYLATEDLPGATLGGEANNPGFAEPVPPFSERFSWLLPVAVGVAAVFVGLILFAALRRARNMLPPPA